MDNFNKRKVKYISIPDDVILDMLMGTPSKYLIQLKTLPEGYETLAVHPDWRSQSFNFLVYHASFPIVPEGAQIPFIDTELFNLKEYCRVPEMRE